MKISSDAKVDLLIDTVKIGCRLEAVSERMERLINRRDALAVEIDEEIAESDRLKIENDELVASKV